MHDAPDYVPNRCRSAVMGDTRPRDIRHKSGLGMARYLNRSDSHFDLCFTPSLPPFPMRSIRLARPAFVNPLKDLLCLCDGVRDGALPRRAWLVAYLVELARCQDCCCKRGGVFPLLVHSVPAFG